MRHERQMELLNRFVALRDAKTATMADKVRTQPTSAYTSPELHEQELAKIFRGRFLFAGLAGDAAMPGDYFCLDLAGLPVVVVRGEDGLLRAMVNMCTHRGARIFPDDHGHLEGRGIACPFHSWSFDMYGRLLGQPLAREGFKECDKGLLGMRALNVVERHGLVFVEPLATGGTGAGQDPDTLLGGADQDLADLNLGNYRLADSRTRTLPLNWKLVIDTFLESYHIFSLHRESIGPYYFSTPNIFESFDSTLLFAGVRSDIVTELDKPEAERNLLPYVTLQYFLYPNALVVHQIDHIETWQVFPGTGPDESIVTTNIYGLGEITDKARTYLTKNLDLLVGVTDTEDFPQGIRTQRALEAGASDSFVFGRNEPGLIHFHEWIDHTLTTP